MAGRTFAVAKFTTVAVADATNFTDSTYIGLSGGSTTQLTKIREVYAAGLEASTSSPQVLLLSASSTLAATLTALTTGESDAPDHPLTAALAAPVVPFTASTTKPQRAKLYLDDPGFNALGGLVRIRYPEGGEKWMYGNAVNQGQVTLSGFTGTVAGLITASLKYETL